MKSSRSTNNKQSKQGQSHKPRPEVRDDLDSHKKKVVNKHNETISRKMKKRLSQNEE
jgi:hypothetical protein